jgi:hypothetical protein
VPISATGCRLLHELLNGLLRSRFFSRSLRRSQKFESRYLDWLIGPCARRSIIPTSGGKIIVSRRHPRNISGLLV